MTDKTQPEALRLADWLDDQYDPDHHKADAAAELRRQHARIAELEAELEAVGGVQALSAAPAGWKLVPVEPDISMQIAAKKADMDHSPLPDWLVSDWPEFLHIWHEMLAASPTPSAEQQAAPKAAPGEPLTISPLEEQQMFDDWCPYKGNPDPRTVWAAAIEAVNGLLLGVAAPQQEAQEPMAHDEDLLERLYWEFDAQRKKTGEERLTFKRKMRFYASEFRRLSMGKIAFTYSVSDDMMNLADRLGDLPYVDPRAWRHLLVYAPQQAPAPLSDAQIKELIEDGVFLGNCKEIVRAIEHAHGITQKGGSNAE